MVCFPAVFRQLGLSDSSGCLQDDNDIYGCIIRMYVPSLAGPDSKAGLFVLKLLVGQHHRSILTTSNWYSELLLLTSHLCAPPPSSSRLPEVVFLKVAGAGAVKDQRSSDPDAGQRENLGERKIINYWPHEILIRNPLQNNHSAEARMLFSRQRHLMAYYTCSLLAPLLVEAQFPPTPQGVTILESKLHENVTISYKEASIIHPVLV